MQSTPEPIMYSPAALMMLPGYGLENPLLESSLRLPVAPALMTPNGCPIGQQNLDQQTSYEAEELPKQEPLSSSSFGNPPQDESEWMESLVPHYDPSQFNAPTDAYWCYPYATAAAYPVNQETSQDTDDKSFNHSVPSYDFKTGSMLQNYSLPTLPLFNSLPYMPMLIKTESTDYTADVKPAPTATSHDNANDGNDTDADGSQTSRADFLFENQLVPDGRRYNIDDLNVDILRSDGFFDMPIKDAAKELDCGITTLKKKCREGGVGRWQYRHRLSMRNTIVKVRMYITKSSGSLQNRVVGLLKQSMDNQVDDDTLKRIEIFRQAIFKYEHRKKHGKSRAGDEDEDTLREKLRRMAEELVSGF